MTTYIISYDTENEINQKFEIEALNESYAWDAFYYEVQEDDPTVKVNAIWKKEIEDDTVYIVREAIAGNNIDSRATLDEAIELLEEYEEADRKDGTYEEGFYEIIEQNGSDYRIVYPEEV